MRDTLLSLTIPVANAVEAGNLSTLAEWVTTRYEENETELTDTVRALDWVISNFAEYYERMEASYLTDAQIVECRKSLLSWAKHLTQAASQ